jgi:hypothetical protein
VPGLGLYCGTTQPHTREAEWAIRLLIYVGGVATTIAGSWIASKIHVYHDNRRLHHEDLKEKVLVPLRFGLRGSYEPLANLERPSISTDWGRRALRERPRVTEEQEEMGPVLKVADPRASLAEALDGALLADALKHHYSDLISEWQTLAARWADHVQECERWISQMGDEILQASGLPPHTARGPYVMHLRLAVTIYQRLFRFQTDPVRKASMSQGSSLNVGAITAAAGDDRQMENLLTVLNRIMETERDAAERLIAGSERLAGEIGSLSSERGLAIAERKLRGRCKMVRFL